MISFQHGTETYTGYLSTAVGGRGPGVIVLQEWWGLVEHIKDICDRLAHSGFTALAPDLYGGKSTTEPDEAGSLMMALNIAETEKILSSAVDTVLSHPSVEGHTVGIAGFCMGGQLALFAAGANPKITATADFYGIHPNVKPSYSTIKGSVLGIFAEHDDYASPAAVAALDQALTEANVPHRFKTFAGRHHAFFNDTRPTVYDSEAAQEAWNTLVNFFVANLPS